MNIYWNIKSKITNKYLWFISFLHAPNIKVFYFTTLKSLWQILSIREHHPFMCFFKQNFQDDDAVCHEISSMEMTNV